MRLINTNSDPSDETYRHVQLLNHSDYGITELRTFAPRPMVAYAENEEIVVRLANQMNGRVPGIYIGVQPRSVDLLKWAYNCWEPACGGPDSNCARDLHIEYVTTIFFDIDVVSAARQQGYPASENELEASLEVARLLSCRSELALCSTICCSGNGHYVLVRLEPIPVKSYEIAFQLKQFCGKLAQEVASQVPGIRIDPVYNLSRVMRLMGTVNYKGNVVPGRPHRRAHFVTEPLFTKSLALSKMILNTKVEYRPKKAFLTGTIKCDLAKIEACEFVRWCRNYPTKVTEPQWFAMMMNLAYLEGGEELIHEISALDMFRYDYGRTQLAIDRILHWGYCPTSCEGLKSVGFYCDKMNSCRVKAPMNLTTLRCRYSR